MARWGLASLSLLIVSPACAGERGYSVTDFDRVDVLGAYVVIIETGKSPSARAYGVNEGIDRLSLETSGRTLRIRPSANGWGGWSGSKAAAPTIRISVPGLREAYLKGSGSLTISKMRSQMVKVGLSGGGQLAVRQIETDRLFATILGNGTMSLAGKAATGQMNADGAGSYDAVALRVDALELSTSSAGNVRVAAGRSAKVVSTGTGEVIVSGTPACTVNAAGAGQIHCGNQ